MGVNLFPSKTFVKGIGLRPNAIDLADGELVGFVENILIGNSHPEVQIHGTLPITLSIVVVFSGLRSVSMMKVYPVVIPLGMTAGKFQIHPIRVLDPGEIGHRDESGHFQLDSTYAGVVPCQVSL
jgi:hypothetical protein